MVDQAIGERIDETSRLPFVYPVKFYIKYTQKDDGSVKQVEWVDVGKKGEQNPSITPHRWKDVERRADLYKVLKPYYENWKDGQATPEKGTPLEAWMADAGLVELLNSVKIRTVEDFAELADDKLTRLGIHGAREKQKRAKAFLEAQADTSKVSAEVASVKAENENLKRELDELRALMVSHAIKKDELKVEDPAPIKRARGRPRKNPEVAIN